MYGWMIFILGILAVVMGALAQNPWVVPATAVSWWVTQYRSMQKVKEKRIIQNRLQGRATRQLFA
jgi:hypothetical protein